MSTYYMVNANQLIFSEFVKLNRYFKDACGIQVIVLNKKIKLTHFLLNLLHLIFQVPD